MLQRVCKACRLLPSEHRLNLFGATACVCFESVVASKPVWGARLIRVPASGAPRISCRIQHLEHAVRHKHATCRCRFYQLRFQTPSLTDLSNCVASSWAGVPHSKTPVSGLRLSAQSVRLALKIVVSEGDFGVQSPALALLTLLPLVKWLLVSMGLWRKNALPVALAKVLDPLGFRRLHHHAQFHVARDGTFQFIFQQESFILHERRFPTTMNPHHMTKWNLAFEEQLVECASSHL